MISSTSCDCHAICYWFEAGAILERRLPELSRLKPLPQKQLQEWAEDEFANIGYAYRDFVQTRPTTGAGNAFAVFEPKGGAMGGADQPILVDQEFSGCIVQAMPLMRADIEPGGKFFLVAINDDRLGFAGNGCVNGDDAGGW